MKNFGPYILLFILLNSCGVKNYWVKDNIEVTSSTEKNNINHTLFFLGDGGKPQSEKQEPTLAMLDKLLADTSETKLAQKSVIFLGDNIYPVGLPTEEDKNRKEAERRLTEQLSGLKNHPGLKIMIPGNHDWNMSQKGGIEQVKREQLFVENYFKDTNTYQPKNACPGPVQINLTDNVLLLIVDSEWWLHKHKKPYGDSSHCDSKTKEEFLQNLKNLVSENPKKTILIAMHHPLFTNGEHGGYFSFKSHLFPLTSVSKNLYIPLPILGSIYPVSRQLGATRQDISNKHYKELINGLLEATKNHKNIIFVAGHEHNLQLQKKDGVLQIVSGAASKSNLIRKGKDALFVARRKGLVKVDCYEDGSLNILFLSPDEHNCAKPLFNYTTN